MTIDPSIFMPNNPNMKLNMILVPPGGASRLSDVGAGVEEASSIDLSQAGEVFADASSDSTAAALTVEETITAISRDDPIFVIGKLADTAVAKDWAGHLILDAPDWLAAGGRVANARVIQAVSDNDLVVYIASPLSTSNLWDTVGEPTVFNEELMQLRDLGYVRIGDYMIHP